jgi:hypothetical protein
MIVTLTGLSQAAWALIAYPPLERRVGRVRLIRRCYYVWPSLFLLCPACNILLRFNHVISFWIVFPFGIVIGNNISMAFCMYTHSFEVGGHPNFLLASVGVLVNDVAPSRQALDTLNIIALSILSIARAIAPSLFGTIYAIGARLQILFGELLWLVFVIFWIPPVIVLKFFPPKIQGSFE